jgi:hypothetical protein
LLSGPWDEAIFSEGKDIEADLGIDIDAAPAGSESVELAAKVNVSISYGSSASPQDFAVVMIAAQHLEAWKHLYTPELADSLPSLSFLLADL